MEGTFQVIWDQIVAAYKLQHPASASIHLVFHVSLLKKVVGDLYQVSDELLSHTDALQFPC